MIVYARQNRIDEKLDHVRNRGQIKMASARSTEAPSRSIKQLIVTSEIRAIERSKEWCNPSMRLSENHIGSKNKKLDELLMIKCISKYDELSEAVLDAVHGRE